jgi:hypothetical protein
MLNVNAESRQFAHLGFLYNAELAYVMTSYSLKCKFVGNLFKYRCLMERVSMDNPRIWDCHANFRSEYSFMIYLTKLFVVWSVWPWVAGWWMSVRLEGSNRRVPGDSVLAFKEHWDLWVKLVKIAGLWTEVPSRNLAWYEVRVLTSRCSETHPNPSPAA